MADDLEDDKELDEDGAAAESGEGEKGEGGNGAKFTPKRIVLFVVLPLVMLAGGGAGAYFLGFLDGLVPSATKVDCQSVKEGDTNFDECALILAAEANERAGAFLEIPNMIVNLNSDGRQARFLKISLKVELENSEELKKFEPLLPRVIDQFQMYLRELRMEDLKGTAGIYRMKIELLNRISAVTPSVKVKDVLFQEILVQ